MAGHAVSNTSRGGGGSNGATTPGAGKPDRITWANNLQLDRSAFADPFKHALTLLLQLLDKFFEITYGHHPGRVNWSAASRRSKRDVADEFTDAQCCFPL